MKRLIALAAVLALFALLAPSAKAGGYSQTVVTAGVAPQFAAPVMQYVPVQAAPVFNAAPAYGSFGAGACNAPAFGAAGGYGTTIQTFQAAPASFGAGGGCSPSFGNRGFGGSRGGLFGGILGGRRGSVTKTRTRTVTRTR